VTTGGIVYPLMFRSITLSIGFPWAVRSIAFVVLGLYLVSYLTLLNPRKTPPTVRRFYDTSAFVDVPFMLLSVASLFSSTAYYIPFLYLPTLAKARVPSIDPDLVFNILAIINGASAVGRLLSGVAAAVYGPTETIAVSLVFGSILLFCWTAVDSVAGIVAWSVFWGMVSGVLVALPGAFIPLFCPSLAAMGTRSGMFWAWIGAGLLIGSSIGGAIYDPKAASSDRWHLQIFAGLCMMAAAVLTVYPIMHLRRKAGIAG
jgi:predicted MFS family arabinose efflux permease